MTNRLDELKSGQVSLHEGQQNLHRDVRELKDALLGKLDEDGQFKPGLMQKVESHDQDIHSFKSALIWMASLVVPASVLALLKSWSHP